MSRPRERVRLEDGLMLDLNNLIRQKLVRPGSKTGTGIRWSYRYLDEEITTGKITADMTYARRGWLRLQFGNLDQWIDLETVPRHFAPRQNAQPNPDRCELASDQKPRERCVWMTTKPAFPALAPMSPAWVHGSPHVEGLALPKSAETGNLSLNKVGIRWMSDKNRLDDARARGTNDFVPRRWRRRYRVFP